MSFLRPSRRGVLDQFLRKTKFGRVTRGQMTPKRAPHGWYKGVGCRSLGWNTKKGRYIVASTKVPVYVVPDLTGFPLKPYINRKTPIVKTPALRLPTEQEREMVIKQMAAEAAAKQTQHEQPLLQKEGAKQA